MDYLATELWTPAHILQQLQLLVLAAFAFVVLQWRQLYPPEQPGVIIDVEWLWRKGGPTLADRLGRPLRRAGRLVNELSVAAGGGLRGAARQVFAPDGWAAAKVPSSATAVLSLVILGLVLAVALFG
jgi:multicomponent Na+:H+ antiporter subunit D